MVDKKKKLNITIESENGKIDVYATAARVIPVYNRRR